MTDAWLEEVLEGVAAEQARIEHFRLLSKEFIRLLSERDIELNKLRADNYRLTDENNHLRARLDNSNARPDLC